VAHSNSAACLAWLVVLEMRKNTGRSVAKLRSRMKYSVEQKLFIFGTFVQRFFMEEIP
jgi:hypothetical protein